MVHVGALPRAEWRVRAATVSLSQALSHGASCRPSALRPCARRRGLFSSISSVYSLPGAEYFDLTFLTYNVLLFYSVLTAKISHADEVM